MDAKTISSAIGETGRIGREVIFYEETDSTNTRALEDVRAGVAADGALHVAGRQTAGRGSGGKSWSSADGLGLSFSVVLLDDPGATPLPFLAAVAITDVLRDLGIDAHVKWPNDVLVGDRKIAGILIEAVQQSGDGAWVVGVGLNVNQTVFPPEIADIAVSARELAGRELDRAELLGAVLGRMDRLVAGGVDLVAEFRARCRMLGRTVDVVRGGLAFRARVLDVSAEGHLVVETGDGGTETWVSATDLDISPRYS